MKMAATSSPKTFAIVGLIVAGLGGGAWGVMHYSSTKADAAGPQIPDEFSVDKIKAMSKEDPGATFEKMRALRDRTDLTDEQREKIRENGRQVMEERMDERMNEYFAAKPEEQEAILDKQIDEMEKFRKDMEARRAEEEKKEKSEEDEKEREKRREEWRKNMGDRSQSQRKMDSEKRDPNKMAQRMTYWSAMGKRMAARGIQPPRFGPGGGGRGMGGPGGGGGGPRRGPGG
jgi:hypothetical protein